MLVLRELRTQKDPSGLIQKGVSLLLDKRCLYGSRTTGEEKAVNMVTNLNDCEWTG